MGSTNNNLTNNATNLIGANQTKKQNVQDLVHRKKPSKSKRDFQNKMKGQEDLEFNKPNEPERSISIGGPPSAEQDTVKTELTRSIETLDTAMPLDKVV